MSVTAYYVCHDCKLAGVVGVVMAGSETPTLAEAERLAFAAAEVAVQKADGEAAGLQIDVSGVSVVPRGR